MASLLERIETHVKNHTTAGYQWPDNAKYAVHYNTSTWPVGWDKESTVKFFTSREELDGWFAEMQKWAELEDNYFCARAYVWDLGPNRMQEFSSWEFPNEFPRTHKEKLNGL